MAQCPKRIGDQDHRHRGICHRRIDSELAFTQPGVDKVARHIQVERRHGGRDPEGKRRPHQVPLTAESLGRALYGLVVRRLGDVCRASHETASAGNIEEEQGGEPDQRQADAAPQDVASQIEARAEGRHRKQTAKHHGSADLIQAVVQLKQPVMNVAQRLDSLGQRDREDHHLSLPLIVSEAGNSGNYRQAGQRHGGAESQIFPEGAEAAGIGCLHGPEMEIGKHQDRRGDGQPRENCPIMKELPNFASATIAPHWQAAYTTFPVRTQAKFERRESPGVSGSAAAFRDSGAGGIGTTSTSVPSGATPRRSRGRISRVLTSVPDGSRRSRTDRSASDPNS